MIWTSGFLEVDNPDGLAPVVQELEKRGIEVNGTENDKIVFLIERETPAQVKAALDALKDIPGVRSVNLSYYSLEGSDEE
ncbi:MAG TPA: chaperone NapD [Thermodesulfobacteriota bacterium]|nr:chaperone NapD [Thermodesulfobacteriota bacterium]